MFVKGLEPHPSHDVISLDKYGSTFDGCAYCSAAISSMALTEPCRVSDEDKLARYHRERSESTAWWGARSWWQKTGMYAIGLLIVFGWPLLLIVPGQ
jgi:hypothetical protein